MTSHPRSREISPVVAPGLARYMPNPQTILQGLPRGRAKVRLRTEFMLRLVAKNEN